MRYSTKGNIENKFEPGSRVLKNKLSIRSKTLMDAMEFDALRKSQKRFFNTATSTTKIDNAFILDMHKHFLGRLYPWGGCYRTVNLSKRGFVWPPAKFVGQNMAMFEKDVLKKYTPCHPGPLEKVAESIAMVHAEFLLIHPFREGNGRIARLIAGIMALQAGYPPPEFGFHLQRNRRKYLQAVKKGYLRDYQSLTRVIIEALTRSQRTSRKISGE